MGSLAYLDDRRLSDPKTEARTRPYVATEYEDG